MNLDEWRTRLALLAKAGKVTRVAGLRVAVDYADGGHESLDCGADFACFAVGDPVLVFHGHDGRCKRLLNRRTGVMLRISAGHTLMLSFPPRSILLGLVPILGGLQAWPYWRHFLQRWRAGDQTLAVFTSLAVLAFGVLATMSFMFVGAAAAADPSAVQSSLRAFMLYPLFAAALWPGLFMAFEALVDAVRTTWFDHRAWHLEQQWEARGY